MSFPGCSQLSAWFPWDVLCVTLGSYLRCKCVILTLFSLTLLRFIVMCSNLHWDGTFEMTVHFWACLNVQSSYSTYEAFRRMWHPCMCKFWWTCLDSDNCTMTAPWQAVTVRHIPSSQMLKCEEKKKMCDIEFKRQNCQYLVMRSKGIKWIKNFS